MTRLIPIAAALTLTIACGKKDDDGTKKKPPENKPTASKPDDTQKKPSPPAKKKLESDKPPDRTTIAPMLWPPPKIEAPKLAATCKALGCPDAKGDFFNKCSCKGKGLASPLAARWTRKYHEFFKRYEFELVNRSARPVSWAMAVLYYYDASGKLLEAELRGTKHKTYDVNGSNFTIAANATKTITLGWSKETMPKDTARIDVVFQGWCYGERDKKTHKDKNRLCIMSDKPPEDKPAGALVP